MDDLEAISAAKGIKLSLVAGFPSYKNSVNKGCIEVYDLGNPETQNAVAYWQYQAAQNRPHINKIILSGYWWDNAMNLDNTNVKISIHPSIRNKPAEAVFKKWAFSNQPVDK